ncbi:hypothetical protein OEZ85_008772 [Tetradesmus obliquus]|uniref:Phosphate transporter n=1 Tax=Tetradesmus obliquus TaxID=3088 RepID=A0ABY8TM03_TETOB|nr:hypothetical protein OEZ85_008772 [Tetradesmus obliquus]
MIWILLATYLEPPVSTTHAIIGGIIGFALGGIAPIVISWFMSPLLAALITFVLFLAVRTLVLRRANSTKIAFYVLPLLILLTFFINLFFILPQTMELISARNFAMANTNATLGRLSALNAAAAAPNASLTEQINAVNASLLGLGNLNGKTWIAGGALQKTF